MAEQTVEWIERFRGLIKINGRYNYSISADNKLSFILAGATKESLLVDLPGAFRQASLNHLLNMDTTNIALRLAKVNESIMVIILSEGLTYDIGTLPKDNDIDEAIYNHYLELGVNQESFVTLKAIKHNEWSGTITIAEINCDFNIAVPAEVAPAAIVKRVRASRKKVVSPQPVIEIPKPPSNEINYDVYLDNIDDLCALAVSIVYSYYFLIQIEAIL